MLALLMIANSLAFAGYCYVAWFITSPHFIEAFYIDITGEEYDKERFESTVQGHSPEELQ